MNEHERQRVRGHYSALKELQEQLERFAREKKLVINLSTFRFLADEIGRIKAGFPDLLPPFVDQEFFAGAFDGKPHYELASVRTYVSIAVAKVAASLEQTQTVEIPSMLVAREGVFFAGQYFDAIQRISEILAQAEASIFVVDGYIDSNLLDLLTEKKANVQVEILTKSVTPLLRQAIVAFRKQYGKLAVRTSSVFHDRFVVVDGRDFYHFGSSLKDAGRRGFMFSRIEEPTVITLLRQEFLLEWERAVDTAQ
jgi:hypothetical protein